MDLAQALSQSGCLDGANLMTAAAAVSAVCGNEGMRRDRADQVQRTLCRGAAGNAHAYGIVMQGRAHGRVEPDAVLFTAFQIDLSIQDLRFVIECCFADHAAAFRDDPMSAEDQVAGAFVLACAAIDVTEIAACALCAHQIAPVALFADGLIGCGEIDDDIGA